MESKLFKQIFIEEPNKISFSVLSTYPRIFKNPTFDDWKQFLDEFYLIDCYVDLNVNEIDLDLVVDKKSDEIIHVDAFDMDLSGLNVLKLLAQFKFEDHGPTYIYVFIFVMKTLFLCCDLMVNPKVKSPPVLSSMFRNKIHPGQRLAMAHRILKRPLHVLLIKSKERHHAKLNILQINDEIDSLEKLKEMYEGCRMIGYFERNLSPIFFSHLHLWSYHPGYDQVNKHGYIEEPKFDYLRFFEMVNDSLPYLSPCVTFLDWEKQKKITVKITDDLEILKPIFKEGYKFCW